MALSIFDDKSVVPDDSHLQEVLGEMFQLWMDIKEYILEKYSPVLEEWEFPGKKYGWSFRMKHKKRAILYLTPCQGYFRVAFVFGDKAVAAAEKSTLPKSILEELRSARKYVEGRGIRIEVKRKRDIGNIKKLIEIKIAH